MNIMLETETLNVADILFHCVSLGNIKSVSQGATVSHNKPRGHLLHLNVKFLFLF